MIHIVLFASILIIYRLVFYMHFLLESTTPCMKLSTARKSHVFNVNYVGLISNTNWFTSFCFCMWYNIVFPEIYTQKDKTLFNPFKTNKYYDLSHRGYIEVYKLRVIYFWILTYMSYFINIHSNIISILRLQRESDKLDKFPPKKHLFSNMLISYPQIDTLKTTHCYMFSAKRGLEHWSVRPKTVSIR